MGIKQLIKTIWVNFRNHKCNVKVGLTSTVGLRSVFEGNNRIGEHSFFVGHLGRGSYIGDGCRLSARIGKYCSIGSNVSCAMGKHPTRDWVSTHPAFFSNRKQAGFSYVANVKFDEIVYADEQKSAIIEIGNDVWIGNSVQLMPGVHVGDGVIIGAGAIVTHDIEPYDIVVGVPAKSIRKRFTQQQIQALLALKWWDKPEAWIQHHVDAFSNIDLFLSSVSMDEE